MCPFCFDIWNVRNSITKLPLKCSFYNSNENIFNIIVSHPEIYIFPLRGALPAPNKTVKWNRHCTVTTCHCFSGVTPERPVCNLQMNLPSALGRLINAFVLKQIEHSWVILSIFPEIFFTRQCFPFLSNTELLHFHVAQVQQVLLIGLLFLFSLLFPLLLTPASC